MDLMNSAIICASMMIAEAPFVFMIITEMPQNQLLVNSLDVWTISSEFIVTGNSR